MFQNKQVSQIFNIESATKPAEIPNESLVKVLKATKEESVDTKESSVLESHCIEIPDEEFRSPKGPKNVWDSIMAKEAS